MARKEHHVVPNKNGGWDVKINDAGHRTYHTRKKSTAVRKARAISRRHGSELVIHNSKGRIEVKNSHPHPTKKRKKTKKVTRRPTRKVKRNVKRSAKQNRRQARKTKRNIRQNRRQVKKAKRNVKRKAKQNRRPTRKVKRNRRRR